MSKYLESGRVEFVVSVTLWSNNEDGRVRRINNTNIPAIDLADAKQLAERLDSRPNKSRCWRRATVCLRYYTETHSGIIPYDTLVQILDMRMDNTDELPSFDDMEIDDEAAA